MVSIGISSGKIPRRICRPALLAAFTLVSTFLFAQSIVRPVNLAYLSRRAGVIVQGRVVRVKYEPLPGYEHIPTVLVTLQVEQMVRGPKVKQYSFRQLMPPLHPRGGKYGAYQMGGDLLLFLLKPSQYGLSSPIGHEQGTFHIVRDAQGRELIANQFANGGLFQGVESDAAGEGLTLSPSQRELVRAPSGPIELDKFVSLVKSLTRLPGIE